MSGHRDNLARAWAEAFGEWDQLDNDTRARAYAAADRIINDGPNLGDVDVVQKTVAAALSRADVALKANQRDPGVGAFPPPDAPDTDPPRLVPVLSPRTRGGPSRARGRGRAEIPEKRPDWDSDPAKHELIVALGDCELWARCSCGDPLGGIRVDQSMELIGAAWERHMMTGWKAEQWHMMR